MKKVLFIVNPAAGIKKSALDENVIRKTIQASDYEVAFEFIYTKRPSHATEIVRGEKLNFDVIVAAGGDGTINEVGRELVGSSTSLGIIPGGSGNGLARSLGIPLSNEKAVELILNGHSSKIDAISINGMYFFNMAGVGFDAYVAKLFHERKNRGLQGYIQIVANKFMSYRGKKIEMVIEGKKFSERAFLMSFANTTQYGNNAHIAPNAKFDDGKIEICIVKDFPRWRTPELIFKMFTKSLKESKYYQTHTVENASLLGKGEIWAHLDGEPITFQNKMDLSIKSNAINVINRY